MLSRRTFIRHVLGVTGAIGLVVCTVAGPALARPADEHTLGLARAALFDATNSERVRNGLAPVEPDPSLGPVAAARAASQLGSVALSHRDADGQLIFAGLLAASGIEFALAGENLARVSRFDASTPHFVAEALLASPTHRKNILEPSFNRLAVGAASGPDGRTAFAQIFRAAP